MAILLTGVDFSDTFNPDAHAMRLTMDPIPSEHRPLIYYTVTALAFPLIVRVVLSSSRQVVKDPH
eukprot:5133525-Amphidinium_carterae.1